MTVVKELIGLCIKGLEQEVCQDILKVLKVTDSQATVEILSLSELLNDSVKIGDDTLFKGLAGGGRVLVKTSCDPKTVFGIKCVQCWLGYVVASKGLSFQKECGLMFIRDSILSTDWTSAIRTWNSFRHYSLQEQEYNPISQPSSFCARCIRDGPHEYNSMEISKTIGDAVVSKFGWKVNLTQMDCEVVAIVLNEHIVFGLNLSRTQLFSNNRIPSEIRCPSLPTNSVSSLRPSTTYLLVTLMRPSLGDILVDVMCGCGSNVVEVAHSHGLIALGGDGDIDLRSQMRDNMQSLQKHCGSVAVGVGVGVNTVKGSVFPVVAETLLWSMRSLPIRTASVDIALVNMPFFGNAKKLMKSNRARLSKITEEVARILRPDSGRVLFLTQSAEQPRSCLDSCYFHSVTVRGLNIGGAICVVIVAHRSSVKFALHDSEGKEESLSNRVVVIPSSSTTSDNCYQSIGESERSLQAAAASEIVTNKNSNHDEVDDFPRVDETDITLDTSELLSRKRFRTTIER
eukprot:gene7441-15221_t